MREEDLMPQGPGEDFTIHLVLGGGTQMSWSLPQPLRKHWSTRDGGGETGESAAGTSRQKEQPPETAPHPCSQAAASLGCLCFHAVSVLSHD